MKITSACLKGLNFCKTAEEKENAIKRSTQNIVAKDKARGNSPEQSTLASTSTTITPAKNQSGTKKRTYSEMASTDEIKPTDVYNFGLFEK